MKRFAKLSLAAVLCLVLTACGQRQSAIIGDWIIADSIPATGFSLGSNGLASSIGHPETQYLKWSLRKQTLFLSGKHYHEGRAIDFTDTLVITTFDPKKELIAWQHQYKKRFVRP